MTIESIIKETNCTIVDVRSHEEFMGGHVANSINIPLQTIPERIEELKGLNAPVVLCCASGNRSGQAHYFLSQHGLDCHNGGSWLDVNYYQSK
jgi:rhodanese-related sulfurtransferase